MKTVNQWLKEALSKEEYAKAKVYKTETWKVKEKDFRTAIESAFIWSTTKEGLNFWHSVAFENGKKYEQET